ncbi:hypothetical protein PT015_17120 [Candidatus Mycobacterium wuenschmannii]|uniref:Secreted protein n=1 Tax=Candidatus Mycobacterium wuenschmannii TaxID=3027808 RepID=A0ABY8VUH1_9MYCO|nr:hypothetical protein [Candidatus Mycobacterium wuenschmannii]WIM86601.1 hypothetical protein PT015_17120 [Candidatus Mycobacterium wuenschmannii]
MKRAWVGALLLGAVVAAPPATADPLPDLSGYTEANPDDFGNYYNYPATYGINFSVAAGYRCRITYTWKANPNVKDAWCWGDLPGTASNAVSVRLGMDSDPARFYNGDLAGIEEYHPPPPNVNPPQQVDPASYKLLPAGSKVAYSGSATCAAADAMTVCVLGEHGFVLKPDGSQAF